MQRSMRSTVEMSMYSLHTSFIHLVKLSTVVSKSSHVNFIMLNTRLTILSKERDRKMVFKKRILGFNKFNSKAESTILKDHSIHIIKV